MSRMVNDITALRLLVGMGVLMLTNTPVYFIYALIFMTYLNRQLTIAAIIPAILLLFGVRRLTRALMERSLKVQQELGNIERRSRSSPHPRRQSLHIEDHEAEIRCALNERYAMNRPGAGANSRWPVPDDPRGCCHLTMIVLIYGGHLVVAGRISIGDLMAFMLYVTQLAFQATSFDGSDHQAAKPQ